jgi:hypothetical protein
LERIAAARERNVVGAGRTAAGQAGCLRP